MRRLLSVERVAPFLSWWQRENKTSRGNPIVPLNPTGLTWLCSRPMWTVYTAALLAILRVTLAVAKAWADGWSVSPGTDGSSGGNSSNCGQIPVVEKWVGNPDRGMNQGGVSGRGHGIRQIREWHHNHKFSIPPPFKCLQISSKPMPFVPHPPLLGKALGLAAPWRDPWIVWPSGTCLHHCGHRLHTGWSLPLRAQGEILASIEG